LIENSLPNSHSSPIKKKQKINRQIYRHYQEYDMKQSQVIQRITEFGKQILPKGASLWLYGSRARGDNRPDSDYDLLILLDKEKIGAKDLDYGYDFFWHGMGIGEEVNAHIYTKKDWSKWTCAPFNENVEEDKIVLM